MSTPVLADVALEGMGPVKALFHHDKNGFFYALDRTNGKFLYGEPIVPGINWARGLDPVTGRPDVNLDMVAQTGGPEVGPIIPSLEGAIDWQPLAYNPELSTLYFMSNQWAMGMKFWDEGKLEKPTNGEWYLGADYQQYLTSEQPGNFVAFDVVRRKVVWRAVSPAPFWAGAVATSSGLVFTGDMRGHFMALDARSGKLLWEFRTGSGIIGSPITYELDGRQYVAVPSGGIGGDMTFYYKEPKAGNLWVFALDGGAPARRHPGERPRHPRGRSAQGRRAGQHAGRPSPARLRLPPHRRARAHQGRSPTPAHVRDAIHRQPRQPRTRIVQGEQIYRARCFGCHQAGGGTGTNLFRTTLGPVPVQGGGGQGARGHDHAVVRRASLDRRDLGALRLRSLSRPSPVIRTDGARTARAARPDDAGGG